jgi:hypothetical protein
MKVDVLGQGLLILAVILLALLSSGIKWTNAMLVVLGIWQVTSAVHLIYVYRHIRRLNYLRTAVILAVSLPVWIHLIGAFAYLPVAGVIVWYFIQTIRDAIVVYRRPRSFWDLM